MLLVWKISFEILMIEIMEDFLIIVINLLFNVGKIFLIVCGKMMYCIVWFWFIFKEWVVFNCFLLIVWILVWIIFVIYVLLFKERVI